MDGIMVSIAVLAGACAAAAGAQDQFEKDVITTSAGDLEITFIGHGTLMFTHGGKVVHVDPWSRLADYARFEKADVILVTHEHRDHLDKEAIDALRSETTVIVVNSSSADKIENSLVLENGESKTVAGFEIEAVPAYNIVSTRENGQPFHPKGEHNGYVITFGGTRVYVAGDTENTPEMKGLEAIDVAFLPMNQPYTMTPEMVADAAKAFKPRILYPYHTGNTDVAKVVQLLAGAGEIDVRVRSMK